MNEPTSDQEFSSVRSRGYIRRLRTGCLAFFHSDIFDKFPEVDSCCCCCSLKAGSVWIAIFTALHSVALIANFRISPMTETLKGCHYYSSECGANQFLSFLQYFDALRGVINLSASLCLLVGICMKVTIAVTIFLSTLMIHIILGILINLTIVSVSLIADRCMMSAENSTYCFVVTVFGTAFYLYCMLVVKSYRSDIDMYHERANLPLHESHTSRELKGSKKSDYQQQNHQKIEFQTSNSLIISRSQQTSRYMQVNKPQQVNSYQQTSNHQISGHQQTDGPQELSGPPSTSAPKQQTDKPELISELEELNSPSPIDERLQPNELRSEVSSQQTSRYKIFNEPQQTGDPQQSSELQQISGPQEAGATQENVEQQETSELITLYASSRPQKADVSQKLDDRPQVSDGLPQKPSEQKDTSNSSLHETSNTPKIYVKQETEGSCSVSRYQNTDTPQNEIQDPSVSGNQDANRTQDARGTHDPSRSQDSSGTQDASKIQDTINRQNNRQ